MVDYSRRLSPHSIRDLLDSWVMSFFHVVMNSEKPLELQQSPCPVDFFNFFLVHYKLTCTIKLYSNRKS